MEAPAPIWAPSGAGPCSRKKWGLSRENGIPLVGSPHHPPISKGKTAPETGSQERRKPHLSSCPTSRLWPATVPLRPDTWDEATAHLRTGGRSCRDLPRAGGAPIQEAWLGLVTLGPSSRGRHFQETREPLSPSRGGLGQTKSRTQPCHSLCVSPRPGPGRGCALDPSHPAGTHGALQTAAKEPGCSGPGLGMPCPGRSGEDCLGSTPMGARDGCECCPLGMRPPALRGLGCLPQGPRGAPSPQL